MEQKKFMNKYLLIALFVIPPTVCMESKALKRTHTTPAARFLTPPSHSRNVATFIAAEYAHERLVNIINQAFDQSNKVSMIIRRRLGVRRSMSCPNITAPRLETIADDEKEESPKMIMDWVYNV
jgi:hypothetical protein